jgi:hypothetical protein
MDVTPKYVLVNIGKNDPTKTIKYEEMSHNQNRSIARGIRAIGGIDLRISRIYLTEEIFLFVPKTNQKIIQTTDAARNQINTLFMLCMISPYISLVIKRLIHIKTINMIITINT